MHWGWTTKYFDATTILVYAFFLFFLGLVYYLRREDKREGYPMVSPKTGERELGFPEPPGPKTYETFHEGLVTLPNEREPEHLAARELFSFPGAPLEPTGDPMLDAVGPASFPLRHDKPFLDFKGERTQQPMRKLEHEWAISHVDPDPRGYTVVAGDKLPVGVVADLWIDRPVQIVRYLEIRLASRPEGPNVLMPLAFGWVRPGKRQVKVTAVLARHFDVAPTPAEPDEITAREEDRISAYFASGLLYATPKRSRPLV